MSNLYSNAPSKHKVSLPEDTLQSLCNRVDDSTPGLLHWQFQESERELLRAAEKYLRPWAWQHQCDVSIELLGKSPFCQTLPGRFDPSVSHDFLVALPTAIVLPRPLFQVGQRVGQRVVSRYGEIGLIQGISYVLQRSPYDCDRGWCYDIAFDSPRQYRDVLAESFLQQKEVA